MITDSEKMLKVSHQKEKETASKRDAVKPRKCKQKKRKRPLRFLGMDSILKKQSVKAETKPADKLSLYCFREDFLPERSSKRHKRDQRDIAGCLAV